MIIETEHEKSITIKTITVVRQANYTFREQFNRFILGKPVKARNWKLKAINRNNDWWNFAKNKFTNWSPACEKKIDIGEFGIWLMFFWKQEKKEGP